MSEKIEIELTKIRPNDYNVNWMTEDEFDRLKEGIKLTKGKLLNDLPIWVRPIDGEEYDYEIVDGEHRYKAVLELPELKLTTILCEIKECTRQEAQILNVISSKNRGRQDYLQLAKVFYENWKGIETTGKEPVYDWERERLDRRLNAPGNLKQKEIGAEFGYSFQMISNLLDIETNIIGELKKTIRSNSFSNWDKLNIARTIHPRLQLALAEKSFDEEGKRVWVGKISKMATFYNWAWEEITKKIESFDDQEKVITWIIDNTTEHKTQVGKRIDYVLAELKGPLYSDKELGLEDWAPEKTTRWDIGSRAKWGPHELYSDNKYHGSYPPQLARNCIWKYSNPNRGETVLDPFLGSGTTAMEAMILGQRCIGIDISGDVVELAQEMCKFRVKDRVYHEPVLVVGDSRQLTKIIKEDKEVLIPLKSVDIIVTHPPYWDMVKFSDKGIENLGFEGFINAMKEVFREMYAVLKPGKFCCVVIGDVYRKDGQVITLIDETLIMGKDVGFKVYDLAIKFSEGQESMGGLMEWRATEHNFLVPKHDFVLIFEKEE